MFSMLEQLDQMPEVSDDEAKAHRKKLESESSPEIIKASMSFKDLKDRCEGDSDLMELFTDAVRYCARYTQTVCDMEVNKEDLIKKGELPQVDEVRTLLHNVTVDSINILARQMKAKGRDGSWIRDLTDRSKYGRFALVLTLTRMGD